MNSDQAMGIVWAAGAMTIVGSALLARRLPIGQTVKMALTWIAIFAVVLTLFSYRAEFLMVWQRVSSEVTGDRAQTEGDTLRVRMGDDGHFWVRATINGSTQSFLIDSGATTIAMSAVNARAAGVAINEDQLPVVINTANGAVEAKRGTIAKLVVGPITSSDIDVVIAPAFGDTNVLGMNFLSSLASWRVEGQTLVLVPQGASTAL